jgi:hypothetical protein
MAESPNAPEHVEAIAFQLLLQKITGLERSLASLPPLLKKIIDHLEAQHAQPEVPVATYAQLYPELQETDADAMPLPSEPSAPHAPVRLRRVWHWFTKEA